MSEHKATIVWSRGGKDFGYKSYSRDHVWRFDNGVEVPASATPSYLGNPQRVDPEAAFVAALSSCHMLTFLALASNKGFVVDSYEDHAVGPSGEERRGQARRYPRRAAPANSVLGRKAAGGRRPGMAARQGAQGMLHCELGDDRCSSDEVTQ